MMRGVRPAAVAALLCIAGLLGACGGNPPDAARTINEVSSEASVRLGDVLLRANTIPGATLAEPVAQQYGIARDPGTVMLLVSVRDIKRDTALTAHVTATASDLLGKRQAVVMREVRSGSAQSGEAFVDYVGSAKVIAPDTLRFDVEAKLESGLRLDLQVNRDFFP